jgi:biotin transport system ATP-binding protein
MSIIEVTKLSYRYTDGTLALTNINMTIAAGEFVVLAGPNGSGKTTLFRLLNGLLRPEGGSVVVDGMPVVKDPVRAHQRVGMVFQDADMQIVGETVYDDVIFGPENLGLDYKEIDSRAQEALASVGMSTMKDRQPHRLSQGEKRRLAVAGVLAMQSPVILFDEPFSNLDDGGVRQVLEQMIRLHQDGHTLIVATHDLEKVIYHADRLMVINAGRIAADGPVAKVLPKVGEYGVRLPCALQYGQMVTSWLTA